MAEDGGAPAEADHRRTEPESWHVPPAPSRLARLMGLAGVALGTTQLLAPARVDGLVGLRSTPDTRLLMRAIGVQEVVSSAGILAGRPRRRWRWLRVAGDVVHLALLGNALRTREGDRDRQRRTVAAVAGTLLLDVVAGRRNARRGPTLSRSEAAVTIARSPSEVYDHYRDLEHLPRFTAHLRSVEQLDPRRSHWVAQGPAGRRVEWDAEIVEEEPGRRLAWRSLPGADVDNAGVVTFTAAPGDRGTEVHVSIAHAVPGGRAGRAVARLFGEHPEQQLKDDLRRLKQVLEVGEVVRSSGSPDGTRSSRQWHQDPAAPSR